MPNSSSNTDWPALEKQLDALLDLSDDERTAQLEAMARTLPFHAQLLRKWLANIERALRDPLAQTHDGQRIGPWRALHRIGRGGMGDVWLAERADGAYEKHVAIKFLYGDSPSLRARLDTERRLLAQLQHPGIPRLIDGGMAADGQPYLVTDFIEGQPLQQWRKTTAANFGACIDLFRQVGEAVAYAHAHLIVHRDIKPNNVLIDGLGRAHLLDFGVAQLLDEESQSNTVQPLTPDYAAPEQITGGPIGVHTDVYALGGLLYFLLCGQPPLDLRNLPLADYVAQLRDELPPPPSRRAQADLRTPRALSADMDAIALKALSKSPEDRYTSTEALLHDIDNALASRPLEARRKDGPVYLMRRYLRRHALPLAAAALIGLSLIVGLVAALWQARIAQDERDRAQAQEQRSESTLDFIVSALSSGSGTNEAIKADSLVELAREQATANTAGSPARRTALIDFVYDVLYRRNELAAAEAFLLPLLEKHRNEFDDETAADLGCKLANVELQLGKKDTARQWLSRSVALIPAHAHPDQRIACSTIDADLSFADGDIAGALAKYRQTLAEADPQGLRRDVFAAHLRSNFGMLLGLSGQLRNAREQYLEALAIYQAEQRGQSVDAVEVSARLATTDNQLGLLSDALAEIDRTIDNGLRAAGPTPNVARHLILKAQIELDAWQPQAALDALDRARTMIAGAPASEAAQFAPHLATHTARAHAALGDLEKAGREFMEASALFDRAGIPANNLYRASLRLYHAEAALPRTADAARARTALTQLDEVENEDHTDSRKPLSPRLRMDQAQAALFARDFDLAERNAGDARSLYAASSAPDGWQLAVCDAILAQVRLAHGDVAGGRRDLEESIRRMKISLGPAHPRIAQLQAVLDSSS